MWCSRPTTGWQVRFNDARRFGLMLLVGRRARRQAQAVQGAGAGAARRTLRRRRLAGRLKAARHADQGGAARPERLVGVGNIYACEALFLAGISPRRVAAHGAGRAGRRGWWRRSRTVLHARDRGRRLDPARPCPAGRRARLFPDALQGLRPRGPACPTPQLRRHRPPARAGRPLDLLLRALPALADGVPMQSKMRRRRRGRLREHPGRDQGPGRHHPAEPAEGAERAVRRAGRGARPGARRLRGRCRHRLHRPDRQREGLRRRRRHQGDEGPVLPGRLPRRTSSPSAGRR